MPSRSKSTHKIIIVTACCIPYIKQAPANISIFMGTSNFHSTMSGRKFTGDVRDVSLHNSNSCITLTNDNLIIMKIVCELSPLAIYRKPKGITIKALNYAVPQIAGDGRKCDNGNYYREEIIGADIAIVDRMEYVAN
jgi:hypothetical protein